MKIGTTLLLLSSLLSSALSNTNSTSTTPVSTAACSRSPPNAQPADGFYQLSVSGDPDIFIPGELYTISLRGMDFGLGPNPFTGFTIWVELSREIVQRGKQHKASKVSNQKLGSFQAYDAQATVHEVCTPAIGNATGHSKTEIQVIWSAPSMIGGQCILLCARVGPRLNGRYSMLARKICAGMTSPFSVARQPRLVDPCCACDEAKYEVTFEGMWSRNTHPREFPPESARAHFGDIIGATHTPQYRVWQEGRVASPGLRRLADDGTTTELEKELKQESNHLRTIIKMRGISWQQVAGAGTPTTFAVFRVDPKNHLVSLVAKIAPSPDWIVGVSGFELCARNCTWIESFTLPLYPHDAGTDDGLGYTSSRMPTNPAVPVRYLGPELRHDVRLPFFSTEGEIRPVASLRLTRLRLYEKNCDSEAAALALQKGSKTGPCAVYDWGAWGPCSVTCGIGTRLRQRYYKYPTLVAAEGCRFNLTQRETCHGPRWNCRVQDEYEPDPAESRGPCAVSQWSEWSPCEGCGVRARTRHYVVPRAMKRCHIGFRQRTVLDQGIPCEAGPCERPPEHLANMTNFDWFFVDKAVDPDCRVTTWSSWSPCSVDCGRGHRMRMRVYIATDIRLQQYIHSTLLARHIGQFLRLKKSKPPIETSDITPEIKRLSAELIEKCQYTVTMQEALCDGDDGICENTLVPEEVCRLPMSVGHCRGYQERWFFEYPRGVCEPFGFSGCGGNANNFRNETLCMKNCVYRNTTATTLSTIGTNATGTTSGTNTTNSEGGTNTTGTTTGTNITDAISDSSTTTEVVTTVQPVEMTTKKWKPTPSNQDNEVMVNDAARFEGDVDCQTGPWLGWSKCQGDCEYAVKLNYRIVVRPESGAGKPCQKLMKSRVCKPAHCRHTLVSTTTTTASP